MLDTLLKAVNVLVKDKTQTNNSTQWVSKFSVIHSLLRGCVVALFSLTSPGNLTIICMLLIKQFSDSLIQQWTNVYDTTTVIRGNFNAT